MKHRLPSRSFRTLAALLAAALVALACGPGASQPDSGAQPTLAPATAEGGPILIGTEYITIENPARVGTMAEALAPLGLTMAKPLPENLTWGKMQPGPEAAINFSLLDNFVDEFQAIGVQNLLLALKSNNEWASNSYPRPGLLPLTGGVQAAHLESYAVWISAVVERYDGDGADDMPGLRYPVRYYEIGVEFSSYEPEPVADYLQLLELAYDAAHAAYPEVQVAHVAFLTSKALTGTNSTDYEARFEHLIDDTHSLAEMRQILDHPQWFDLVNFHAVGANEVEPIVGWLRYEMERRGYRKPIIISDTVPMPLVGWGAATSCERPANQLGAVLPPATEADRCRLADYFTALVNGDEAALRWTQAFTAIDLARTVIIAAEQDLLLVNTAYTEDLPLLTLPVFQAAAGTGAWAGLLQLQPREYRAGYYALQQVIGQLGAYNEIRRIPQDDPAVYLYEVQTGTEHSWIAWYDPGSLALPGDPAPSVTIELQAELPQVTVEALITAFGQQQPEHIQLATDAGAATLTLSPTPIFIYP
jgi:hypothetical protein